MRIAELLGKKVVHKFFGEGIVSEIEGNIVTIKFEKKSEPSQFSYPASFRDFLKAADDEIEASIRADVEVWLKDSGTLDSEALRKKTVETQTALSKRVKAREKEAIEKARREAERSRFFSAQYRSNIEDETEE